MSRNSGGTYTAPANSWNPAVEGSAIDEADWNATLTDLESALTDSLDRTGKGKITAHIDFDENASPGTPDSNVGRLYVGDDGGVTTLYFKDAAGNVYNLNLAAASGLPFTFNSTTTTNADPGAGKGAFNNATISSATEMALSTTTSGGADVAAFMATWDDSGTTDRGRLLVQKRTDASKLYILRINGANTDATGYKRIAIEYVSGAGSISNTDPLAITYMPPGSAGFAWQGAWLTSTAYAVNDGVSNGGSSYICTQAHTSGASTEPDVGASWASYWEVFAAKGTDGAGTGDVTGGAASSDGEVVFYSGTSGKAIKRSNTISGLLKLSSGVASAALYGTDLREFLSANRTYYVRTDGNDSNTGLADNSGGAFLTIQAAIDKVATLDISIYSVTVQVRTGTYAQALTLKDPLGSGSCILLGDTATLTNCKISPASGVSITANGSKRWSVSGFEFNPTSNAVSASNGAVVGIGANKFNASANGVYCDSSATVNFSANFTIAGGGTTFFNVSGHGTIVCQSVTVTITGTPAFAAAFAFSSQIGYILAQSLTFSGSATGPRYSASSNAVINTGGGGASYFPGNSAGSTATGGVYA